MNGKQTQLLLGEETRDIGRFEALLEGFCRKYTVSKEEVLDAISGLLKNGR